MAVVLVGTLDTKGHGAAIRPRPAQAGGCETLVIDAGSLGPPTVRARHRPRAGLRARPGRRPRRSAAGATAGAPWPRRRGAWRGWSRTLHRTGRVDGVLGLGGSAGTTIGTAAMRALPFGVPKVMVSTLASGQVAAVRRRQRHLHAPLGGRPRRAEPPDPHVAGQRGARAGRHGPEPRPRLAAAATGPADRGGDDVRRDHPVRRPRPASAWKPRAARSWSSTPRASAARRWRGSIRDGRVAGVLDLTTTELADELVGGILSAGPDRLEAAVPAGIPQVVSVGALDMVNFGPSDDRPRAVRRPQVPRPQPDRHPDADHARGERRDRRAGWPRSWADRSGPVVVMLPLGGVSAIDVPGGPFHDPEADAALFGAIRAGLSGHPSVRLIERDEAINDPAFADAAAGAMLVLETRTFARLILRWAD